MNLNTVPTKNPANTKRGGHSPIIERTSTAYTLHNCIPLKQQTMGNAASSLPYSIGKPIATQVNHGWALHDGQRKSDGHAVSVFMAKKPSLTKTPLSPQQPHLTQYAPALHHYVHSKKLRHPHILTVIATLDTDNPNDTAASNTPAAPSSSSNGDLIIVTEACIPFSTWISSSHNPPSIEQIVWGLECVVRALSFLHTAQMCHGSISLESLYVTPAGDVKLWNFAILSSFENATVPRHFTDYEGAVTPALYRSPERAEGRWDAIGAAGVHVLDSYAIGILIGQMFPFGIPTPLVKAVQRLQTTNLKMRPKLAPLLKCPVFDTPYQKLQCQLEEFTIAPVENKILFWQNITPQLPAQLLPHMVVIHRILPLIQSEIATICGNESLRTQEAYRKEGAY
jgi:SCY1-like protein 1